MVFFEISGNSPYTKNGVFFSKMIDVVENIKYESVIMYFFRKK